VAAEYDTWVGEGAVLADPAFVQRTVGRYFAEGYWDGPGLHNDALPIGAYRQMLSTYVDALTRAGFVIHQLREPRLDHQPVWQEVPQLLYVRCHLFASGRS
jgi:hypothetical protein